MDHGDDASRVRTAVSAEPGHPRRHPVEGPFIIVMRAGRFVTCLGKGMRVTKEPAITALTRSKPCPTEITDHGVPAREAISTSTTA